MTRFRFVKVCKNLVTAHHIAAQGSTCVRISRHPCISERHSSTLSSPFHPTSSSSHSPSISCSPLLLFFHYLEDSSNTPYSAKKEMELLTSPTSTQKTSRPYEKDIQLGRCPTHLQRWSATWRAKDVPNPSSTRPFERRHFSLQPKYQVNSAYIHDTRNGQQHAVKKGQSGWVLQAVIPRASI